MKVKINGYTEDLVGKCIINGKTYKVPNSISDEVVEVDINKTTNKTKLIKVIEASPKRIKVKCPIYERCGGCKLLHIDYVEQQKIKTDEVKSIFKNAGFKEKVNDIIGMDKPFNYRNKNQVVFGVDDKNKTVSGFFEENSHKIVNFTTCLVQDELSDKIVGIIKELMEKFRISPYNEQKRRGLIKHVMVKRSKALNETMVVIVTSEKVFPGSNNFVKALVSRCKEITTIIQNINPKQTTHVLGDSEVVLYGKGYIHDILMGMKFKISSKSFYQINPVQTKKLYEAAINSAKLTKNDIILDAYSGVGTIGICASPNVSKVISVELEKSAHMDAIINAKLNNIKNVHFYNDDATRFINNLAVKKEKIDVVIMDPPRKGSDASFLKAVIKLNPRKVIYISCDPHTQINDLKYLTNDYKITYIQPVDMFPQTEHIENIVTLERR
jgi:23S rRNA (uracil1939-C5)-methyltransferase